MFIYVSFKPEIEHQYPSLLFYSFWCSVARQGDVRHHRSLLSVCRVQVVTPRLIFSDSVLLLCPDLLKPSL